MECFERTTAFGSVHWGQVFDIELFSQNHIYRLRYSQELHEVTTYGFRYRPPSDTTWELGTPINNRRVFQNEAERAAFMAHNFSDVKLEVLPEPVTTGLCGVDLTTIAGEIFYSKQGALRTQR